MEKIQEQNKLCLANVRRSLKVQESVKDQSFKEEQMLQQQSEDLSSVITFKDPSFLALISLQSLEKPWEIENYHHLPHEVPEFHYYQNPSFEDGVNETVISSQELPLNPIEDANSRHKRKSDNINREKRKRKRTKPTKNIEELENQRMTHIAVERNRRRQMNIHLNSLRSLIPPSYIQRGDQASIVGGAIDFVKILEQHLQSLEAQKITQESEISDKSLRDSLSNKWCASKEKVEEDENSSKLKIDATVIESHVNLKIQCPRKQGQLLRSIILLEKLRFSVLHLNITSPSNTTVSYSFNLKMGDDCNFGSADEITAAVRRIFEYRLLD